MRKLLIILLLSTISLSAQNYADKSHYLVDSLNLDELSPTDSVLLDTSLTKYHGAKNAIDKIHALQKVCEKMMHDDWIKYQFFQYDLIIGAKTSVKEKDREKLVKMEANALNNIGFYHKFQGRTHQAIVYYKQALGLRLRINDLSGLGASYNNLGRLYQNMGDFDNAIEYLFKGLKTMEEAGDINGLANLTSNLGTLYDNQGEFEKALEYYKRGQDYFTQINDNSGIAMTINNIGFVQRKKGNLKEAIKCFNQSLKMQLEEDNISQAAYTYNNLGQCYRIQKDYTKTKELYEKAIEAHRNAANKQGLALSLNNMANLMYLMGNVPKAFDFAYEGYQLTSELGYPSLYSEAEFTLSRLYVEKGNYKKALEHFKSHVQMRDSLSNTETQKSAAKQQAKYEYEKQKAIDDAEHDKQLAIEQEAKEKQTILTYATAGGLGLVGVFLLFVFSRLRVTRKQKSVIELAHTELEEKNQEILDSISYAKRIQSAILPPDKVVKSYLENSFVLYKPKDIVAGDFYWMEPVGDKVLFAAADCTGHGVPGAMVSVVCNNGLNRSVREHGLSDPGKILDKTKEIVVQEFEKSEEEVKDGMDIALCSLQGNKLQYAGAHNPLWIIRKGATEIEEIKANKQPIGKTDQSVSYTTHTIELNEGDCFYIFSDGFADQFGGEKGKKMKTVNFKKLLLSVKDKSMEEQLQHIDKAFTEWKGELEQLDDVCVMGVRI